MGKRRAGVTQLQGHMDRTQRRRDHVNATGADRAEGTSRAARVFGRDFWGARCGKSARRVLRGEGGTRSSAAKAALYPPNIHGQG